MDEHEDLLIPLNLTSSSNSSTTSSSIPLILFFIMIMFLNFISYSIITILLNRYTKCKNKNKIRNYNNYFLRNPDPPEDGLVCSICLENLTDNYVSTTCNHYYHEACIYEWLKQKVICPNCKTDLNRLENI